MEEKKSPASAAESAASGQPAAVPAAELRPGRRKFPTVGDLFAMLGIAFGAQIVVGTAANSLLWKNFRRLHHSFQHLFISMMRRESARMPKQ